MSVRFWQTTLLYMFDNIYFHSLQLTASDQTRAVIDDVQINHSGTYMCEVTVTPTFFALMQFANMTVISKYCHFICLIERSE